MEEVLKELGYCYGFKKYIKAYKECIVIVDIEDMSIKIYSRVENRSIRKRYSSRLTDKTFKDVLYAKVKDFLVEGESI